MQTCVCKFGFSELLFKNHMFMNMGFVEKALAQKISQQMSLVDPIALKMILGGPRLFCPVSVSLRTLVNYHSPGKKLE